MTEGFVPRVRVFRSPWEDQGVTDLDILRTLEDVGFVVGKHLMWMVETTRIQEEHDGSLACALLDPTRETPMSPIESRVMAVVLFGPKAVWHHLGTAVANADRYDRRGACTAATFHAGIVAGGGGLNNYQSRFFASKITRAFARSPLIARSIAGSQKVVVAPSIDPDAPLSYETDELYSHIRSLPHIGNDPLLSR